jgi:hypothetical protein
MFPLTSPLKQFYIPFVIFPNLAVRVIVLHASYFESPNKDYYYYYYYYYYYWKVGDGDFIATTSLTDDREVVVRFPANTRESLYNKTN